MEKSIIGWYLYITVMIGMFTVLLSVWYGNFHYIPVEYFDLYQPVTIPTNVFIQYVYPHLFGLILRGIIWALILAFVVLVIGKYMFDKR